MKAYIFLPLSVGKLLARFGGLVYLGLFATVALAATDFDHWRQNNPSSTTTVSHSDWGELLSRYVSAEEDGVNRFGYDAVSAQDDAKLNDYLARLAKVKVTDLAADEQMAYWINLYNAVTLRVILDHYPLESIHDISFSLFTRGPWQEKLTSVEGVELSLDNIEHNILRPIFGDNRVHHAVNCASIGCPNLQSQAFTGDNLEALLERSTKEYINHPRGARFEQGQLIVSSLYDWYAEDFGNNQREVIAYLAQYAHPALKQKLSQANEIDEFFYDWALNAR